MALYMHACNSVTKNPESNFAIMGCKNPQFRKIQSFLILFMSLFISSAASESQNFLQRGSSLSVGDDSDLLISPDKTFSCGFYRVGINAYSFSIWFTNSNDRTLVWMASRERPVSSRGSRVSLRKDGAMVMTDVDGTVVWETSTTPTNAETAELLNTGNLVLKDTNGNILWQSFDFPTDTLLPNQFLTKDTKLTSTLGEGNFSSGYYSFYFDSDNVLKLIYDGPDISSIYWPNPDPNLNVYQKGRTNYNSSRRAVLDDSGSFVSSDWLQFNAADVGGSGIRRRLTIDYDGNLRLYSLNNGYWNVSWQALAKQCEVHGVCGRNGICVYTPESKCSCPPGYEPSNSSNWNQGCKPKFNRSCSGNQSQQVKFVQLHSTDFNGFDYDYHESISLDSCREICLQNCQCEAFSYRMTGEAKCWIKTVLFNGYKSPGVLGNIYLKLPTSVETPEPIVLNGSNPSCGLNVAQVMFGLPSMYDMLYKSHRLTPFFLFALAIGAIEILFFVSGWWFIYSRQGLPASLENGYLAVSSQFKRFTYGELKKATKNFKEELGRGAFGAVYKGTLVDNREVAVKRLGDVHHGEEGFWAEVSTIGKLNHMNLVRMWGYCYECRQKLLVYEYIKNQSLDRHLFSADVLGWKERFKIALGTAKGLAYLHHECLEWIFHCDVKPENILLDDDFEPKIADFGLAKLTQRDSPNSELSRIRGTKGYMAPEWALSLPITAKVDVYSFGVVILELVKGIRLSNWVVEDSLEQEVELMKFVRTVKRTIQCGEELKIEDIVDPRLEGKFSRNQAMTMVEIGISCVEEDRSKRPTMDSVVQVLQECEDETEVHGK